METKHTPGPWRERAPEIRGSADENYRFIEGGVGYVHPEEDRPGFSISGFIRPADSRLIAAAPELLEALDKCRSELSFLREQILDKEWREAPTIEEALLLASHAIAKAEGGAQ